MSQSISPAAIAIRAAADAWAAGEGCDESLGWSDEYCETLARFAILASREPTLAMVQAGYREKQNGNGIAGIWHAMIDEMLGIKK
jgi:hypothetical protein